MKRYVGYIIPLGSTDTCSAHNMAQICSLKQVMVEFITDHIASKDFLDKLLATEKDSSDIQHLCLKLVVAMIESTYVAIDNLNQLLSIPAFIQAIAQLLQQGR